MKNAIALWTLMGTAAAAGACAQLPMESNVASQAFLRSDVPTARPADSAGYETRPPRDPSGIGRYYLGRQIAHVMGHEGADWLERDDRATEEGTALLIKSLSIQPTYTVADLGAGTGYFSFRLATLVPNGRVLAEDIQPEMIAELNQRKQKKQATNVQPVLGTTTDPHLPASSVDLVLLVDAYHEFDHPREMGRAIRNALRPRTGRLALVEYRAEDPNVPIKPIHKMTVDQAKREMSAVGLELVEVKEDLPQQHLMLFRRP